MRIEIDPNAGFCFGVVNAIKTAEENLSKGIEINCLGEIVHNEMENNRLKGIGMKTVKHDQLPELAGRSVLIRAHGEPPSTYELAKKYNINLVDATCPVVLKLQERVRKAWERLQPLGGTVIIFGKKGHAEVIGLCGQTNNQAVVVQDLNDLDGIDFSKPVEIFSQTTKEPEHYREIVEEIKRRVAIYNTQPETLLKVNNTICGQVSNRKPHIKAFAQKHDVMIFVSGTNSSNGKMLFEACLEANPNSHLIVNSAELNPEWLSGYQSVGISGATSTPLWLMQEVASAIEAIVKGKG
ncbi:4-hydroxy-3-methylbut-2-enyl diphosphate reductase [Tenuifilum osseticum]|uniref:4-hydroxy-3-methylbut-2-enyl diphosphate reductase n=1 Tax=Tenuifilum osseticum TaxID=3374723 RepID=UPI0034E3D913